ncbi:fkbM family methyltransferase [Wolffia australiana]
MANAWRRERAARWPALSLRGLLAAGLLSAVVVVLCLFWRAAVPEGGFRGGAWAAAKGPIEPLDCRGSPQAWPVFASSVEGLARPFLYSLADLGSLPERPHKNIARMLKGKPFRRPDISLTVQQILGERKAEEGGLVVDVGANVGMATFAAAAMGFRVLALEPVPENLQRLCDGLFLNRAWDRVTLLAAAASDRSGNITLHKLVGRLDNSAVSAEGARMAFKDKEEVAVGVAAVRLDDVVPAERRVALLKIDVQGWELHVLRGARELLSRKPGEAPYLIYEEDERLLRASNATAADIRRFLAGLGYHRCQLRATDAHCTKD